MKEKLKKAAKIILMIFGILFLIQIILFCIMMIGLTGLSSAKSLDFKLDDKIQTSPKPKEMSSIIKYVEDYQTENKKYPETLENTEFNQNPNLKYETTKDGNCYTITLKEKSKTKQYQHCTTLSKNSSSTSESYVEYSN